MCTPAPGMAKLIVSAPGLALASVIASRGSGRRGRGCRCSRQRWCPPPVQRLGLVGADVHSAAGDTGERHTALVGGQGLAVAGIDSQGVAAGVDRRAAGEQGHGRGRPAVFCKGPSFGSAMMVLVSVFAPLPVMAVSIRLWLPVKVSKLATSPPEGLLATMVLFSVAVECVVDAAAEVGRVARQGGVGQCRRGVVVDAAAEVGRVARQGGVGQRRRGESLRDAAAGVAGRVARQGGVGQRQRAARCWMPPPLRMAELPDRVELVSVAVP